MMLVKIHESDDASRTGYLSRFHGARKPILDLGKPKNTKHEHLNQLLPSDLFGSFKWPFQGWKRDLPLGYQRVTDGRSWKLDFKMLIQSMNPFNQKKIGSNYLVRIWPEFFQKENTPPDPPAPETPAAPPHEGQELSQWHSHLRFVIQGLWKCVHGVRCGAVHRSEMVALIWGGVSIRGFYPQNGSGQIIIFHQPGFPWNKGISLTKPPFGVRSCEVAIIWPDGWFISWFQTLLTWMIWGKNPYFWKHPYDLRPLVEAILQGTLISDPK